MNKLLMGVSLTVFGTVNVFADGNLLLNNQNINNGCNVLNLGAYDGTVEMVPSFSVNTYVCNPGYYLPADGVECVICPQNNYCVGGGFQYNTEIDQGIAECPNTWYSPAGMHELASCGRILHIGDNVIYLRSAKKTTPSLNVKIGNDIFYGNITTNDVVMHSETEQKLKLNVNDTTYSVYDDTVSVVENPTEPLSE